MTEQTLTLTEALASLGLTPKQISDGPDEVGGFLEGR